MKNLKTIGCYIVLLAFITVAGLAYIGISVAVRTERGLHAMMLTVAVVQKYVEKSGEWPKSWKDLESVSNLEVGMLAWPRDFIEIQQDVEINFNVTLSEVASQEADTLDVIKPRVPAYGSYRNSFYSLIETARKMENIRQETKRRQPPKLTSMGSFGK
jgi:hypothetical protein